MEVEIIQFVQSISCKFADLFFKGCTLLSEEAFLIVLIAFIYWCFDKRVGECLLLALYTANTFNSILKDIVRRERPFIDENVKDKIRYVKTESIVNTVHLKESFSFPSGHSANISVIMTTLCLSLKKSLKKTPRFILVITFVTIPLVMISRVYLGVHFPTDVLAGAAIGVLSAFLMTFVFFKFHDQRLITFAVVYILSLSALLFEPTADTFKMLGVGLGGISGMMIERRFINFSTDVGKKNKALRVIYGAAFLSALRLILKAAFPAHVIFGFIRYAVIGFSAIAVCPAAFKKFKI